MKRFLICMFIGLSFGHMLSAQNPEVRDKIEAARIALITKELNLTPEQAQKFWPIYNEFKAKRNEIATSFRDERDQFDPASATEDERKQMVAKGLELKQQQLNLEKEYSGKLMDIITSRQVIQLRQTEEKFRRLIMERIQQNRDNRQRMDRREQMRDRRDEIQRRRNDNN